jgi:hypothetical protein
MARRLTDYALRRFALAGNSSDRISRIEAIAQAGATKLRVSLGAGDLASQTRCMRILGTEIMPRFMC